MKILNIDATETSPKVYFDTFSNYFEISGESRPENVQDFYMPIMSWIKEFKNYLIENRKLGEPIRPLNINIKLEYFNSSSAKYILDLLKSFKDILDNGFEMTINWHYENEDEDMLEAGQEMSKMLKYDFNYIQNKP